MANICLSPLAGGLGVLGLANAYDTLGRGAPLTAAFDATVAVFGPTVARRLSRVGAAPKPAELEFVGPPAPTRVPPSSVQGLSADGVAKLNRPGYQNYRLETNVGTAENPVWRTHYHGYIEPGETAAAISGRHARNIGSDGLARFNPTTDRIMMVRGDRLYGEARLMEHRNILRDGTYVGRGRDASRRGNNQNGLQPARLREYEAWERALNGQ